MARYFKRYVLDFSHKTCETGAEHDKIADQIFMKLRINSVGDFKIWLKPRIFCLSLALMEMQKQVTETHWNHPINKSVVFMEENNTFAGLQIFFKIGGLK